VSELQFVVIVALLGGAIYLLWSLRHEQRIRHQDTAEQASRKELDDELRRLCPNIAISTGMKDLRDWQAVHLRVQAYYDGRKRSLMDPHSDEPKDWSDIAHMYQPLSKQDDTTNYPFPAEANEEEASHLKTARTIAEDFIRLASQDTCLTSSEVGCLLYSEWRRALLGSGLSEDGREKWNRPDLVLPYGLGLHVDLWLKKFVREPKRETPPEATLADA